jgi:glycogen debranching enzyme
VWAQTQEYYARFFDTRLAVHSPDPLFNKAIAWAELAIDKAQVATATGDVGLVAGWYPSFDSARPGFGWFFGRDTLWSIYAIDSYSDAALVRRAIDFLVRRQRADGKMMHEFSQSADVLTGAMAWPNFPYEYAAADSTPLYLLAMQDYVCTTGDLPYLKSHWESLQRAYRFERAHDSDGDGVYDNSEGTGWVEGWPPKLPHQEFYLAALDRDATYAMAQLAQWIGDDSLSREAQSTADKLSASVRAYRLGNGTYAFSKDVSSTYDPTLTVYPAVALWGSGDGMAQPETMLSAWSSHLFATDWGTRAVSESDPVYDPISYHQGSVWPLFTGWTAMAEYRSQRPLAGYAALRQNIDLTWVQDPGAVTEVLSGRFYQPLGRSSTHQLWSSAMVLAPALRGLFGIEADAPHHALLIHPQLPANWDRVTLDNVRVGDTLFVVSMQRAGEHLEVLATSTMPTALCLRAAAVLSEECREAAVTQHHLRLKLPPVEVGLIADTRSQFGDVTREARVTSEHREARSLTIDIEAQAGSTVRFAVRSNGTVRVSTQESKLDGNQLVVSMPYSGKAQSSAMTRDVGDRFVTKAVTLRW